MENELILINSAGWSNISDLTELIDLTEQFLNKQ